jgi:hypothetical protein
MDTGLICGTRILRERNTVFRLPRQGFDVRHAHLMIEVIPFAIYVVSHFCFLFFHPHHLVVLTSLILQRTSTFTLPIRYGGEK